MKVVPKVRLRVVSTLFYNRFVLWLNSTVEVNLNLEVSYCYSQGYINAQEKEALPRSAKFLEGEFLWTFCIPYTFQKIEIYTYLVSRKKLVFKFVLSTLFFQSIILLIGSKERSDEIVSIISFLG